jgi:hypothetical protein
MPTFHCCIDLAIDIALRRAGLGSRLGVVGDHAVAATWSGTGVVGDLASAGVSAAARLPYGIYAALFGCVLPVFFSIFLAVGWLLRSLLEPIGRGSGGSGHRVDA